MNLVASYIGIFMVLVVQVYVVHAHRVPLNEADCRVNITTCWDGFVCFIASSPCTACTDCQDANEQFHGETYCHTLDYLVGSNAKLPPGTTFSPNPSSAVVADKLHYKTTRKIIVSGSTAGHTTWTDISDVALTVHCPSGYYATIEKVYCQDRNYNHNSPSADNTTCSSSNCVSYPLPQTSNFCRVCGVWDRLPECEMGCVNVTIPNGNIVYTNQSVNAAPPYNGTYPINTTATFTCAKQFYLSSLNLTDVANCTGTPTTFPGNWSFVPQCVAGCTPLTNLSHGQITYSNDVLVNGIVQDKTNVNFTCGASYYRSSNIENATCTGHSWNPGPDPVTCLPGCGEITQTDLSTCAAAVSYPTATYNGLYRGGSVASVTCNSGYYMPNKLAPTVQCTQQSWSSLPKCIRLCPKPPDVPNAKEVIINYCSEPNTFAQSNFTDGCVADYTCADGYDLIPDNIKMPKCDNGNWINAKPICSQNLTIVRIVMTMSCVFLVGALSFIVLLTLILRDFSVETCIHLGEEISLLIAHVIILIASGRVDLPICNLIGAMLQYFITTNFFFMLLESLQSYSMLQNVISFGGFCKWPRLINLMVGWIVPLIPTGVTFAIYYSEYQSGYGCWINYDMSVAISILAPMVLCFVPTIILTEAATVGNTIQMPLTSKNQSIAALLNQKSILILMALCAASCVVGSLALFHLSVPLYAMASPINTALGISYILFHFAGNPKLINWFRTKVVKKLCRKGQVDPSVQTGTQSKNDLYSDDH